MSKTATSKRAPPVPSCIGQRHWIAKDFLLEGPPGTFSKHETCEVFCVRLADFSYDERGSSPKAYFTPNTADEYEGSNSQTLSPKAALEYIRVVTLSTNPVPGTQQVSNQGSSSGIGTGTGNPSQAPGSPPAQSQQSGPPPSGSGNPPASGPSNPPPPTGTMSTSTGGSFKFPQPDAYDRPEG